MRWRPVAHGVRLGAVEVGAQPRGVLASVLSCGGPQPWMDILGSPSTFQAPETGAQEKGRPAAQQGRRPSAP